MPFDLRQLRYALAAAKLGSYHHAARTCGVSEETIAESISALDGLMRVNLFEPAGTGILPTADGIRFLREAEHLLWRAEQIASLAAAIPGQEDESGKLFGHFEIAEPLCGCSDHNETSALTQKPELGPDVMVAAVDAQSGDRSNAYVDLCRSILSARQLMGRAFGTDLFADPAGEMLLDLYVREHDGMTTSISKIWNASNAAYGTARRSLGIMERRGLIARSADTQDGRRTLVLLTDLARAQLEACLDIILDSKSRGEGRPHEALRRSVR